MKFKKITAVMLAACLLAVNVPVTAFADALRNEESTENLTDTAISLKTEDIAEGTASSDAEYIEDALEEKNGKTAGELQNTIVLTAEASDGVIVTMKARTADFLSARTASPSDAKEKSDGNESASPSPAIRADEFNPELLALSVEVIEQKEEASDEELEKITKDDNIASHKTYDICVFYNEEEIEPLPGRKVEVSFRLPQVPSGADNVSVYHHAESGIETVVDHAKLEEAMDGQAAYDAKEGNGAEELTAENAEEITETASEAKTSEAAGNTNENAGNTDSAVITIGGETTGFSFYDLYFTYNAKTVTVAANVTESLLNEALKEADIKGQILEAKVYQDVDCTIEAPEGIKDGDHFVFKVFQKENVWYYMAEVPFSAEHGLWVKMENEAEYKINVTATQSDFASVTYGGDNIQYFKTLGGADGAWSFAQSQETSESPVTVTLLGNASGNLSNQSGKNIILDLNGYVLKGSGSGSVISNYGALTITDSNKAKAHYFKYSKSSAWTLNDDAAEEAIKSAIEPDAITDTTADDTLIKVTGGCITGGNSGTNHGGGVIVYEKGTLTMTGGSICGNQAAQGEGGGLYTGSNTIVNLSNVTIVGNYAKKNCGGMMFNADKNDKTPDPSLTIGGKVRIIENTSSEEKDKNLTLWMAEAPLVIDSLASGSRIGLTIRKWKNSASYTAAGAFTSNGTEGDTAYFLSDFDAYGVTFVTDHLELEQNYKITLDPSGGTVGSVTSVTAINGKAMPAITGEGSLPSRTGHTFAGYFDAQTGGSKYYNADGTSAKTWDKTTNTTLYAQWTAKTAPQVEDLTLSASSCSYDGEEHSAAFTTGKPGMGAITVKYRAADTTEWSDAVPVKANRYYVKAVIAEGTDYASAELTSDNWEFTISPRQLAVEGTKADGKTYDGTATATAHIGTTKGKVDGDDVTVSVKTAEFEDKDAGNGRNVSVSYSLTGSQAGNYTAPADSTTSADIEKRAVTLTSGSATKTYDGKPLTKDEVKDTLTGSASEKGFVTGEGVTCIVTGTQTTIGTSKNSFTYTLKEGTKADNYEITKTEGDLTVSKVTSEIIITANSNTKVYDGAALTDNGYTYTKNVLAEGDVLSAVVTGTITDAGTTANRVTSYRVMRGTTDVTACYTFGTSVDGTLEITKAEGQVTAPAAKSLSYNGQDQTLVNAGSSTTGTVKYSLSESGTYATAIPTGKAAGDYDVWYYAVGDSNHKDTVKAKITVTIAREGIAIPSEEIGLVYDGRVKTGVKGGTGYTLSGNTATNAGGYTATATLDGNHKWVGGSTEPAEINWSIARATYDMSGVSFADKEVVYDGTAKSLAITGTLPNGVSVSYEGNGKTEAGVYPVTAKFTGDYVNYEKIPDKTAKLTINALAKYKITYDLNGGKWSSRGENPTEYTVESDFSLKAPEREGYVFIGWEGTELTRPETVVLIGMGSKGDRSYKANWKKSEEKKIAEKIIEVTGEVVTPETALTDEKALVVSKSAANTTNFSSDHVEEAVLEQLAESFPKAKTFTFGITVELKALEENKQSTSTSTKVTYDATPYIQAIDTDGTVNEKIAASNNDLNGKSVNLHLAVPKDTEFDSAEIVHSSAARASEKYTSRVYTDENDEKYVVVSITHFSTFEITLKESTEDEDSSSPATAAWLRDAKGWRYRFADGSYATNGWYEINNPYATGTQEKKSWFHFGADGYMQTGWFTDRDGKKYYLNPDSDGTLGRMTHGRQTIDGKEYEFSEVHDGYFGHLTGESREGFFPS